MWHSWSLFQAVRVFLSEHIIASNIYQKHQSQVCSDAEIAEVVHNVSVIFLQVYHKRLILKRIIFITSFKSPISTYIFQTIP